MYRNLSPSEFNHNQSKRIKQEFSASLSDKPVFMLYMHISIEQESSTSLGVEPT
jgi:hypothetical protein